eukprot:2486-Heterococcus_DN1.PRE.3
MQPRSAQGVAQHSSAVYTAAPSYGADGAVRLLWQRVYNHCAVSVLPPSLRVTDSATCATCAEGATMKAGAVLVPSAKTCAHCTQMRTLLYTLYESIAEPAGLTELASEN